MTDRELMTIPYIVYESTLEKEDRQQKRLVVIIAILVAMLFISNAIWIYAWNSYDYVEEYSDVELNSEGEGNANYIGEDGDINNVVSESNTEKTEQDS